MSLVYCPRNTFKINFVAVGALVNFGCRLAPSFGEPRTVVFDYEVPTRGGAKSLDISVVVFDVAYQAAERAVAVHLEKAGRRGRKAGRSE